MNVSSITQHVQVSPGVYYLGQARDKLGRVVDGYAFVDYKKNGKKPADKPGGKPSGNTNCYSLLARGAKWRVVENYMLDPTNGSGISEIDLTQWTNNSLVTWNAAAGTSIFGNMVSGLVDGADEVSPDGKNEIMFGTLSDSNTIAVAITWGIFGGPPRNRELIEFDIVFNDSFLFGDACVGSTNSCPSETLVGNTSVMDYMSVAVHEAGHAAGLGHAPETCPEDTMYPYTSNGVTKGRTLNSGDIAGIKELY
jgi:hypothetical protein